jgi:NIMA-interacting peptidyl-prolyl cis-trans isomerase 4
MGKSKPDQKPKGKASNSKKDSTTTATKDKDNKPKPATSINVRHILCEKHSKMETVLSRLAAGERFDAVARDMSEDKARQGGSLGWKTRGSLIKGFEDAAYQLSVSSVDKPVYTCPAVKTSEG